MDDRAMLRQRRALLIVAAGALASGVALGATIATAGLGAISPSVTPSPIATLTLGDDLEGKRARAAATVDVSKALCRDEIQCPPPAHHSRFDRGDGFYRIPPWDDRQLSAEVKALDPRLDPFWPRFVQCMQSSGVGLDMPSPEQATQVDIDRLVDQVNATGPFYFATPEGLEYRGTLESDAFERCEVILYERRPV
jgi:hypothetical protein